MQDRIIIPKRYLLYLFDDRAHKIATNTAIVNKFNEINAGRNALARMNHDLIKGRIDLVKECNDLAMRYHKTETDKKNALQLYEKLIKQNAQISKQAENVERNLLNIQLEKEELENKIKISVKYSIDLSLIGSIKALNDPQEFNDYLNFIGLKNIKDFWANLLSKSEILNSSEVYIDNILKIGIPIVKLYHDYNNILSNRIEIDKFYPIRGDMLNMEITHLHYLHAINSNMLNNFKLNIVFYFIIPAVITPLSSVLSYDFNHELKVINNIGYFINISLLLSNYNSLTTSAASYITLVPVGLNLISYIPKYYEYDTASDIINITSEIITISVDIIISANAIIKAIPVLTNIASAGAISTITTFSGLFWMGYIMYSRATKASEFFSKNSEAAATTFSDFISSKSNVENYSEFYNKDQTFNDVLEEDNFNNDFIYSDKNQLEI